MSPGWHLSCRISSVLLFTCRKCFLTWSTMLPSLLSEPDGWKFKPACARSARTVTRGCHQVNMQFSAYEIPAPEFHNTTWSIFLILFIRLKKWAGVGPDSAWQWSGILSRIMKAILLLTVVAGKRHLLHICQSVILTDPAKSQTRMILLPACMEKDRSLLLMMNRYNEKSLKRY